MTTKQKKIIDEAVSRVASMIVATNHCGHGSLEDLSCAMYSLQDYLGNIDCNEEGLTLPGQETQSITDLWEY